MGWLFLVGIKKKKKVSSPLDQWKNFSLNSALILQLGDVLLEERA